MNENIVEFEEKLPHRVEEMICIRCKWRGIIVFPAELWFKRMECPKCHRKGFMISTGQDCNVS